MTSGASPDSPAPLGARVDVVAAVIEREGRILIARRPPGAHLGGLWEFPGGKRHPGERPAEALRREIAEELGVAAVVGEIIETIDWSYPGTQVRLRFFRCAVEGEPRPLEGQEIAWIAPADLGRYAFPPADAALLARLTGGESPGGAQLPAD
ncbi:MAG TPA: 8-oxo-dGTP diphosphatase MutT [Candidatus Binatia bacterium]|nr:8-oxo-dGTP diphosphatase MutT [Candidatus Binatia bacterium]